MSLWARITDALSSLTSGDSLSDVFAKLRTPPERSVAFAIAVIALGAKMAKADGQVTKDEVAAFREVFTIPPNEEKNAGRLFNLARTDVAGCRRCSLTPLSTNAPHPCEGPCADRSGVSTPWSR